MSDQLAPQYEAFIQEALAAGRYPSREKLVEAALDSLRERESVPQVPEEHRALVEAALKEVAESGTVEMTDADWSRYREVAREAARTMRRA